MTVPYYGDFAEDATVYIPFNTFTSDDPAASATITNFINTDVHIHKDGGTTQRNNAAGITVAVDYDSITGNHLVTIDTSDNTVAGFWVAGSEYQVRIEGTTVDAGTVNAWIGSFSIERSGGALALIKAGVTLANDAITAAKFDESTAFPVKSADTGATQIARVGADGDTLETLSDQLDLQATASAQSTNTTHLTDIKGTGFSKDTHSLPQCLTATGFMPSSEDGSSFTALNDPTAAAIADAVWDETLTGANHNTATSAGRRLRGLGDTVSSTVNDAGASTTVFITNLTETTNDHYADQVVRFTDGNLAGQVKPILSYNGTSKTITLDEALTEAPGDGDAFDIIPQHIHPVHQIVDHMFDEPVADHVTAGTVGKAISDLDAEDGSSFTALNDITAADVWDLASALTLDFGTLMERAYQLLNNEMNVTDADGTAALRNIADSADIATGSITDNDTTTSRAGWTWA